MYSSDFQYRHVPSLRSSAIRNANISNMPIFLIFHDLNEKCLQIHYKIFAVALYSCVNVLYENLCVSEVKNRTKYTKLNNDAHTHCPFYNQVYVTRVKLCISKIIFTENCRQINKRYKAAASTYT